MKTLIFSLIVLFSFQALANMPDAPDMPLKHCYHWLKEDVSNAKILTYKYKEAERTKGEFSFHSTTGNNVRGAGIYCAKTLLGSIGYGDRVVRIEFAPETVFEQEYSRTKACTGIVSQAECNAKKTDVLNYSTANGWYVIKSPDVILSWSANSPELVKDLQAIQARADYSQKVVLNNTLALMAAEAKVKKPVVYYSPIARRPMLELLDDDSYLAKAASQGLVLSIANYKNPALTDKKKLVYIGKILNVLIGPGQQFDAVSLNAGLEAVPGGQALLRERLRTSVTKGKIDLTPESLISVMKYDADLLSQAQLNSYIKSQMGNSPGNSGLDKITDQFAGDKKLMKALFASLPAPEAAADLLSTNRLYVWIKYFSEETDLPSDQTRPYFVAFVKKGILEYTAANRNPGYAFPAAYFDTLKNPALGQVLAEVAKSDELLKQDSDFLRLWEATSYIQKRAGAPAVAELRKKLESSNGSLKGGASQILNSLANSSKKLDEASERAILLQLIDMELENCKAGKTCKVDTLAFDEIYSYIMRTAGYYYNNRTAMTKAYFFYDELSQILARDGYATIAWAAYEMMARTSNVNGSPERQKPYEMMYSRYYHDQYDAASLQRMVKMVRNSYDANLLKAMIAKLTPQPGVLAGEKQTRAVMAEIMYPLLTGDIDSAMANENVKWMEALQGRYKGILNGTAAFGSTICEYLKAVEENDRTIAKTIDIKLGDLRNAYRPRMKSCQ